MSTFNMNNATDVALKMDVYAIYLCKSRADLEAEKLSKRLEYGYEIIGKKKKSSWNINAKIKGLVIHKTLF